MPIDAAESPAETPRRIVTTWFGPKIDPLFSLCVASWIANGFEAVVYSYRDRIEGLPPGARIANAESVFPEAHHRRFQYRNGHAHFSDLIRMALLRRGEGTWCDADYLALGPFPQTGAVMLGRERGGWPCNAVMRLPPEHPIAVGVLKAYESGRYASAPWSLAKTRWRALRHGLSGKPFTVEDLPHAHWGRHALSFFVRKLRMQDQLLPEDAFFAPETYTNELLEPKPFDRLVDNPDVYGIHFFAKTGADKPPVPGSLYDWAWKRYAAHL